MALGIGFGAERIGLAAIRWPKTAAALVLALLTLIGASLPNLRFDDDIHRVFLSDSALSDAQRRYEAEQNPPTSTLVAHVQSADPFTAADLTILRDISLDLGFIDGVIGVASPFILRMSADAKTPDGQPVFPPLIADSYGDELKAFRALDTGLPTFINGPQTALLISVSIDLVQARVSDIVPQVEAEFARALPENLTLTVTGEDAISLEIVSGLKEDLVALNLWGGLLVAFVALVLLRDLRMVLLAVVPALCGAASVLALSVWLSYPITVLSNVIPILLLVLGVADGVHLTGHLKSKGHDVADTVRQIGPACALTALTTAAAFASIVITGNAQLFEFAVLGALGTLVAFAITLTLFTLLAQIIKPSETPSPRFAIRIASGLAGWGTGYPRTIIISAIVVFGLAMAGYLQTKPWFPLYQNLPDGSAIVAANDAISDDFGGVFQMIVEIDNDWEKVQALTSMLGELAGPEAVLSEVNIARWLGTSDLRPTLEQLDRFPIELVQKLRPEGGVYHIFVSTAEPMRSDAALLQFDALIAAAEAGGAERIIGLPTVMRQEAIGLISQLSRGLVIASLGATLLVALAFGSLRLFPILLMPNILPLVLTGASLHIWARGELTPTAVLALTIAFGIAIDDTVHFVSRYADARHRGETSLQSVTSATKSAGQVMILTTVLLSVGLCVTLTSDFPPIRLFGGMMIITLWAALLFDLLLLPALLSGKDRLHVRR